MRSYELKLKNLGLSWKTHKGGIYLFTFPNGKKYVGQTKNFYRRFLSYKHCEDKQPVNYAIKEFGWDSLKIKLLYVFEDCREVDRKVLLDLEHYYIEKFDSIQNGYNVYDSVKLSTEVKKKISGTLINKYKEGVIDICNRVKIDVLYDGKSIGIFKSITDAANYLGCSQNVIGNRIRITYAPKSPFLGHYTFKIIE